MDVNVEKQGTGYLASIKTDNLEEINAILAAAKVTDTDTDLKPETNVDKKYTYCVKCTYGGKYTFSAIKQYKAAEASFVCADNTGSGFYTSLTEGAC